MAPITTDILIKLACAGPKLSCAEEVEPFVTYYDGAYNWELTEEQKAIAWSILRSKITGEPLQLIIAHPQIVRWTDIKLLLRKSFMDHRSTECLIDAIVTAQLRGSVLEFYKYINQLRTKAVLRFKIDNPNATTAEINTNAEMIGRIAVKQFKKRLYEPLRSILEIKDPKSLEDAIDYLRNTSYDLRWTPNNRQVQGHRNYNYQRNNRGERPPQNYYQGNNQGNNQGTNNSGTIRSSNNNVNQWQSAEPMDLGSNSGVNFR